MYALNEKNLFKNNIDKKWWITYLKKGNTWPDSSKKVLTSDVWICKAGYSWKFSKYMGQNLQEIVKQLKAVKI